MQFSFNDVYTFGVAINQHTNSIFKYVQKNRIYFIIICDALKDNIKPFQIMWQTILRIMLVWSTKQDMKVCILLWLKSNLKWVYHEDRFVNHTKIKCTKIIVYYQLNVYSDVRHSSRENLHLYSMVFGGKKEMIVQKPILHIPNEEKKCNKVNGSKLAI